MNSPINMQPRADLRDYLAAERTFLAWIRTGLALMGFGFVVARFGLFLQGLMLAQHSFVPQSYGLSLWFGTGLIAVGVFVNIFAGWRHMRMVRQLDHGAVISRPSNRIVLVAFFLAMVGLAMAIYLMSVRFANMKTSNVLEEPTMSSTNNGIINLPTHRTVDEAVEALKNILQAKGITLFALVDHSGEAEKVGIKMLPTKLLIFGSPKAGTPVMLAVPSSALDLPLKILIWQDTQGKVWVSYNSPAYLQERHGFPQELVKNINAVEMLAAKAAE